MKATSTELVRHWASYLLKVRQGATIEVTKFGKTVARLYPAPGIMSGKTLAAILRRYQADPATTDELERVLKEQETYERSVVG